MDRRFSLLLILLLLPFGFGEVPTLPRIFNDDCQTRLDALPPHPVFQRKNLTRVQLKFDMDEFINNRGEKWQKGNFVFSTPFSKGYNGTVKLKMRGQLSKHFDKYSISLQFDEDKAGLFYGLSGVAFRADALDPTGIREEISLELHRSFGLCPQRTGFAAVTVNGDFWGVYVVAEIFDDTYIETRYDTIGHLYKSNGNNLNPEEFSPFTTIRAGELALGRTELKSQRDANSFLPLSSFIGNMHKDLINSTYEVTVDTARMIKSLVMSTVLAHWDDYSSNTNNFYVSIDEFGRCSYHNYDMDLVLGVTWKTREYGQGGWTPNDKRNWLGRFTTRPLVDHIYNNAKYMRIFYEYLREAVGLMRSAQFREFTESLRQLIRPWMVVNSSSLFDPADFDIAYDGDYRQDRIRPDKESDVTFGFAFRPLYSSIDTWLKMIEQALPPARAGIIGAFVPSLFVKKYDEKYGTFTLDVLALGVKDLTVKTEETSVFSSPTTVPDLHAPTITGLTVYQLVSSPRYNPSQGHTSFILTGVIANGTEVTLETREIDFLNPY